MKEMFNLVRNGSLRYQPYSWDCTRHQSVEPEVQVVRAIRKLDEQPLGKGAFLERPQATSPSATQDPIYNLSVAESVGRAC